MKFRYESLREHGAGPLYSASIRFGKGNRLFIRLSKGGYGNIRPPAGLFRLYPTITYYKNHVLHVHFLSLSLSIGKHLI